ncbi:MAG: electron transfer flavoprotein subunit beta [Candidatus Terraquivivens tikiterensis]|uniref:Electron transfer flavoprotein subunit beta n=1 Tax=Candidatus Terraquivivens tikiterensis TaxID=1980982 RepID=A0A2R7Y0L1_9ARCH|nr:MAG: electron transfer flavoprotein subunit beta [Candidatus Terraquivivens tikiterensis]
MPVPLDMVVCVKWVPNTQVVNIDPRTGTLIREGVPSIINPHDLNAVELGLRLKDSYGGRLTAIAMSPPSAKAGLEFLIGMGVDRAILITDRAFAGADTLATSYVLAKAIERLMPVDIAIFGQETIDSSTAHICAQTASWLKLPYIYYVVDAKLGDGKKSIVVRRVLEREVETFELPLPCLISVAMKSNVPRPVTLSNKIRAKTEGLIEVWSNDVLKLDVNCIGLKGSPTVVSKSVPTPVVPRKKLKFEGTDPAEAARWLLDRLEEEGVKVV